ncbi:DgyrCDS3131 [Dimorphilus gyrociliatus]|uniref:DgyrCDS3131 n=1 Tax=Dimorphilus gyrociliatus TaxID=2664684 RepID=A0A7I8VDF4_9ANNE|nr:DgyrCDS3131 [Dimorphilus gyrociliatus]
MDYQALVIWLLQIILFDSGYMKRDVCSPLVRRMYDREIEDVTKTELEGEWTSDRCEVRSGPEYITRKYTVYTNDIFDFTQFYYGDADCTHPIFSITSQGSWTVSSKSRIISPGIYNSDYRLYRVVMMAYTEEVAAKLYSIINSTCSEKIWTKAWHPRESYVILHYVEHHDNTIDYDCTFSFDFSLNELQLVRVESSVENKQSIKKLLLGDVHTHRKIRKGYRPTAFQAPLLSANTKKCSVCKVIAKSDIKRPPILHHHGRTIAWDSLTGEWFSERCESRPGFHFLTRRLSFSSHGEWRGYYHYYSDVLCRDPLYTIKFYGSYKKFDYHRHMKAVRKLVLIAKRGSLKVEDQRISDSVNNPLQSPCGIRGSWKVGVEQDITKYHGCAALGIALPFQKRQIARVQRIHHHTELLMGEWATSSNKHNYTPTSFQPPLKYCGKFERKLDKMSPNSVISKPYWGPMGGATCCICEKFIVLLLCFLSLLF